MEASFRSRLDRTFGFLNDAKNDGDVSHLWSVEERAASMKNKGLAREGDSDDDEVSGFLDFLKSGVSRRERSDSRFFGEEDLEELESGDEEDDDGGVDGDGDEDEDEDEEDDGDGDEEEQMRLGKKKKKGRGEQTEVELVKRASEGDGPLEPSKEDDDEEREVREMVGMDCTLDFEDEEDEYDKVAVGVDGLHDRLFMSQIRDFGASRRQLDPLPTSFVELRQASRDRRANHKAALARLEEDDREAATRAAKESSQASAKFKIEEMTEDSAVRPDHGGEAMDVDDGGHKEEPRQQLRTKIPNLESSLVREGDPAKRRKSGKRVRFSVDDAPMTCTPHIVSDLVPSTTSIMIRSTPNRYSKVPDYVKNPSKYIHYTLDWSDEDEEQANMAAFHAARVASSPSLLSSSTQDMVTEEESQGPSGSTKISFNPLVKRSSKESSKGLGKGMGTEAVLSNRVVNVAANFDMDLNLGGLITMEDDSTSSGLIGQGKSSRVVRRYRNRVTDDIETD